MGHSAGAHLVDLLAADPEIAFHEGAKPWLGTVSLDTATLDMEETMRGRHYSFFDAAFGKDPAYWAETSPIHRLKAAPKPMLLVCSTRRSHSPCLQAQRFGAKVISLGGRATVLPKNYDARPGQRRSRTARKLYRSRGNLPAFAQPAIVTRITEARQTYRVQFK
jgi:arylformamidase